MKMHHLQSTQLRGFVDRLEGLEKIRRNEWTKLDNYWSYKHRGQMRLSTISEHKPDLHHLISTYRQFPAPFWNLECKIGMPKKK